MYGLVGNCEDFAGKCPPHKGGENWYTAAAKADAGHLSTPSQVAKNWSPQRITKAY